MRRAGWMALLAGLLVTTVFASGCGDDDYEAASAAATSTAGASGTGAAGPTFPAGSAMARLAASGRLTVGVKGDQPGFGAKDASGKLDGFDVAVGREIAKALGLRDEQVTFIDVTSSTRTQALNDGKVDLVIATMTITEARRQEVEFSRPYFLAGQSLLVQRDNTSIRSVADLNGRKACSVTGSTSATTVRERAPQVELLSLDGYAACVTALKEGRVEAVTTDDAVLSGFAKADASLKLVGGTFTQEPYGVAAKKGQSELATFVSGVVTSMLQDGRWERLYSQYFGGIEGLAPAAAAKAALPGS